MRSRSWAPLDSGTISGNHRDRAGASLADRVIAWTAQPHAASFPMQAVLGAVWTNGQHFLSAELLTALDHARTATDRMTGTSARVFVVRTFLATVLDKYDGRYAYATYLALPLFEIPPGGDADRRRVCDGWLALLVADAIRFEQAALDGTSTYLPELRPSAALVGKRVRLGTRVLAPVIARLAIDRAAAGRDAAGAILAAAAPAALQVLAASMQPVYVIHDEYLFVRVLQSFEMTFTALRRSAEDALAALRRSAFAAAAAALALCADILDESQSLFSLLATMRPEAFRIFRQYTEGASAIQSVDYKTFEMLCAAPPVERLDSAAFMMVPAVRRQVLAGADSIAAAFCDAHASARMSAGDEALLVAAMRRLDTGHRRWKQIHYKLAVHMIGGAAGTGYTAGVPYLRETLANALLPQSAQPANETTP